MRQRQTWVAMLVLGLWVSRSLAAGEPVDLLGAATWEYFLDKGKTPTNGPVPVPAETEVTFLARTEFEASPAGLVGLELRARKQRPPVAILNGQKLAGPMPGMYYDTIPAVEPSLLKDGRNTLLVNVTVSNKSGKPGSGITARDISVEANISLLALKAEHLAIQSGPIMGMADEDVFTFTCRTNLPARVVVEAAGHLPPTEFVASGGTFFHRFRVPRSFSPAVLKATMDGTTVKQIVVAPAWFTDDFQFVVLGDSRTRIDDWRSVATAASARNPQLVIISGDVITNGKYDTQWDLELFAPGRELLGRTPTYIVIGNHEQNAPMYDEMFHTLGEGGKERNWYQQIGGTVLIGIDGAQDWSPHSPNAKWLEQVLAAARSAKFIFLTSHYPPWSSSGHGKVDENGMPVETPVLQMRQTVAPLLAKYKATAMFAGHDHTYERSETDGLTFITSGGAGAPRYSKSKLAEKQNPHSVVYKSVLHYCLVTVASESCAMNVYTPQGEEIDTRIWAMRE